MLRYVLLKAPVPASTGSSARPNPEASCPSPPPPLTARKADSCHPTSNLFPCRVVPQPQPLSGVGEIKENPAGEVRSEFRMIILCIHTILTPSGPAAPPGRDWSERGGASPKLHSTLDAPSPVVLTFSMYLCKSKIGLIFLPKLDMLHAPVTTGNALFSAGCWFQSGRQEESPRIQIFLVEKQRPPPFFLVGGAVPYQEPGGMLRV